MNKRRIVLKSMSYMTVASAVGLPLLSSAAVKKIDPSDPQAQALGYVDDTTKADEKKYPKHDKSQMCNGCQFYVKAQEENKVAPCTILGNKGVAAQGWCSAWAKRAS